MGTFGTPSSYNNTGALGSATNPTTAQGLSRDRENQKAILELPGTQAWVEKTITDGVIVPTSAEIIVLPEGGASTDSLTTIVLTSDGTTTLHEGMPIRLKAANSNTITVVHGTGTNNISTIDGNNVVLDTTWYLELKLIGGLWVQQETNAYKIANAAGVVASAAQSTANIAITTANTASTNAASATAAADAAATKAASCSTAASTANKTAACSGFVLSNEARMMVIFANANTVAGALTLNVNSTGAKAIYNELGAVSAANPATFPAGVPIEFIYDGTNWTYRKYQDEFAKIVGGAPMYACRAWVNFDGTATPITIRASGNISSITDNGVGDYTINFIVPMPDTNYSVAINGRTSAASSLNSMQARPFGHYAGSVSSDTPLASAFRFGTLTQGANNNQDGDYIMVTVYR